MALALQRPDDTQLVFGIDAGEYAHVLDNGIELRIVHVAQFGTGDGPRPGLEDVEFARNRFRGSGMIAGDHDRANMRPLGDRDGGLRFRARRIDHADQSEQHEIILDLFRQLDIRLAAAGVLGSMPSEFDWH